MLHLNYLSSSTVFPRTPETMLCPWQKVMNMTEVSLQRQIPLEMNAKTVAKKINVYLTQAAMAGVVPAYKPLFGK